METIRVVIATFKNKISQEEIPFFRGSIIRLSDNASFFHNHQEEGFRYAYPFSIQTDRWACRNSRD